MAKRHDRAIFIADDVDAIDDLTREWNDSVRKASNSEERLLAPSEMAAIVTGVQRRISKDDHPVHDERIATSISQLILAANANTQQRRALRGDEVEQEGPAKAAREVEKLVDAVSREVSTVQNIIEDELARVYETRRATSQMKAISSSGSQNAVPIREAAHDRVLAALMQTSWIAESAIADQDAVESIRREIERFLDRIQATSQYASQEGVRAQTEMIGAYEPASEITSVGGGKVRGRRTTKGKPA